MKLNFYCFFFCLFAFTLSAQESFTLKGKVVSASDSLSIIGANVVVVGESRGTTSDVDGNFSINVSKGTVLNISFIGFTTQTYVVDKNTPIKITLVEDKELLDEIVIVAYGEQKKSSITGSVAQLNNKNLDELPYSRVDQALQGKIAGVQVQNVSGSVGEAPQISIRGLSSISANSSPLVVVDGFPIAEGLEFVNPNSIKSIEVLKDASSTALYGSRGANGVILVTTKDGGITPKYTFKAFTGFKSPVKSSDVMNAYEYTDMLRNERQTIENLEAQQNGTTPSVIDYTDRERSMRIVSDQAGISDYQELAQRDQSRISSYQFDVSGGNANTKYYLSSQWIDNEGLLKDNYQNRFNLSGKLSTRLNKKVEIGINFRPSYTQTRRSTIAYSDFTRSQQWLPVRHNSFTSDLTGQPVGSYAHARHFNNTQFSYLDDMDSVQTYTMSSIWGTSGNNAIAGMENEWRVQEDFRLVTDGFLKWKIAKGLTYRGSAGSYIQYRDYEIFRNSLANQTGQAYADNSTSMKERLITEHTLAYDKTINKHDFQGLLGTTYEHTDIKNSSIYGTQFPTDFVQTINAATLLDAGETFTNKEEIALSSYLARVNYAFDNKYLLSLAGRYDGSSLFGPENKYGFFPSISAGWNVHSEKFWKKPQKYINQLKLRGSYGLTGNNNIENYAFTNLLFPSNYSLGNGGGSVTSGLGETGTTLGNPSISWEQTYQYDFGADIQLFRGKVALTADYYYSITDQLLLRQNVSQITGHDNYWNNIGKIENQGVELVLSTYLNLGKVSWIANVNFSTNQNRLISLGGEEQFINQGERSEQYISRVGEEAIQFYGYRMIGVWQTQKELDENPHSADDAVGGIRVADINGDGEITAADRTTLGSPFPDFTWGFSNTFKYKGFDLYFLIQGSEGAEVYYGDGFYTETRYLQTDFTDGWWYSEDVAASKPREKLGRDWMLTDYLIQDASYVSVREIVLGYTLPLKWVNRAKLESIRIFASGQNLLYFMSSDYFGINPEGLKTNSEYSSPLVSGYQRGAYPVERQISFGIDINF